MLLCAVFSVVGSAENKADVTLKDSNGNVIESYEIVSGSDRTVDSRPAIQSALNKAKALASKENQMTVTVPHGEYFIGSTLVINSYCTLDLGNSVIKRTGSDFTMIRLGTSKDDKGGYDGYDCVTVKNGVLDGEFTKEKVGAEMSALMKFSHAQNITLENVTMQNTFGVHHQLSFGAAKNVKIKNCSFLNMDVSSLTTENVSLNCEAIQLDILNENCFPNSAPYDGTTSSNVEVTGCTFKNVPRGFGTHSTLVGTYIDNVKINNNYFENISGYAIRTANYRNGEINNNTLVDCGNGIMVSDIPNSNLANTYLPDSGTASLVRRANMTIKNNTISIKDTALERSYRYGIEIYGEIINNGDFLKDSDPTQKLKFSGDFRMSAVTIENNSIASSVSNSPFYALNIKGGCGSSNSSESNFKIIGNSLSFAGSFNEESQVFALRLLNSEKIYVSQNKTESSSGKIFSLVGAYSSKELFVEKNSLQSSATYGMNFSQVSDSTIKENTVQSAGSVGLYVYSSSSNVKLQSNVIASAATYGLSAKDSRDVAFENNTVTDKLKSMNACINADSCSEVNISGNTLNNSANIGIRCTAVKTAKIESNAVNWAGGNSIYAYSNCDDITVKDNTITGGSKLLLATKNSTNVSFETNKISGSTTAVNAAISAENCSNVKVLGHTFASLNGFEIRFNGVTDGQIENNNLSKPQGSGIYVFGKSHNINVKSNTVSDAKEYAVAVKDSSLINLANNTVSYETNIGSAGFSVSSSKDVTLESNSVSSCAGAAIKLNAVTDSQITNNSLSSCGDSAVKASENCSNVKVLSNTVENVTKNALSFASCSNITVSGNIIEDSAKKLTSAAYFQSCSSVSLDSNTVGSCGSSAFVLSAVTDSTVNENEVKQSKNSGISVKDNSSNIAITSNIFSSSGQSAISIANSNGISAEKNTVKDGAKALSNAIVASKSSDIKLLSNKVTCFGTNAVLLGSVSGATVSKNTLSAGGKNGIYVYDSCKNITVTSNKIYYPSSTGIYAADSQTVTISSNTLSDKNKKMQIGINSKNVSDLKVSSNTVSDCAKYGIFVSGANAKILSNTLSCPIYLKNVKTKSSVSSNTINSPKTTALTLYSCKKVTVEKNTIGKAKSDAIYLFSSASCTISSNKLKNSGACGIKIKSSTSDSILKNEISSPLGTGIYVYESSENITVDSNSIDSAKGTAVDASSSKSVVICSNKITNKNKATKNAVSVRSCSDVQVLSNSASSVENGVYVKKSDSVTIEKNTLSSCSNRGVYVCSSSKKVQVISNTINKPKLGVYAADSNVSVKGNNVYSSKSSAVYFTGKATGSINSNYIFAPSANAIYLCSSASVSSIGKNLIDMSAPKASAIVVDSKASAKTINSNQINCKSKSKSKSLKVSCSSGIVVKSKNSKTTQINSNKISACKSYGIYVVGLSKKPTVKSNTISSCKCAIVFKSATLSSNKFTKCTTKTKKL